MSDYVVVGDDVPVPRQVVVIGNEVPCDCPECPCSCPPSYSPETCEEDQESSINDYGEFVAPGAKSMGPTPYASILNVFNSSAIWTLKLPGGHTRFVTAELGTMVITPVNGMYLAELTLVDVPGPSADPYEGE